MTIYYLFAAMVVLLFSERIAPAEIGQPFRNTFFNLLWYPIINLAVILLGYTGIGAVVSSLVSRGHGPWISLPEPEGPVGNALFVFLYIFVWDFFNYWFHRAQHEVKWLWPTHKLHHSDESLNVSTSFRVHWTHHIVMNFLLNLPMYLFVNLSPAIVGGGWPLVVYMGMILFQHMNLRLEFGPFAWMLVGPQTHRIHHSRLPVHFDKNYAAFFPIYDIIFGTYHHPCPGEFPPTGVAGEPFRNSLWWATVEPFVDWMKMFSLATIRAVRRQKPDEVGAENE